MSQTTTPTSMVNYREGMIAEGRVAETLVSGYASADLAYGLLLQQGSAERVYKPMDALPAADVDAFVTAVGALATAATAQTFSGADFDGAVGAGLVPGYSQRAAFFLSNHADWDATIMQVCYENSYGVEVVESVDIPNGGNTTVYTQGAVSLLKWIYLPAQSGVGGSFTVGQDPTQPFLGIDRRVFPGVGVYMPGREPNTDTAEVDANERFTLMEQGRVAVVVEKAVTVRAPAYVRVVTAATDVRGQWQGEPDTNFVRVPGACFASAAGVDGLAVLELGGVS